MQDVVQKGSGATPRTTDVFRAAVDTVVRNWWVVAVLGAVFGTLACIISLFLTPIYAATATLYVTSGSDANSQTAYQGGLASQLRVGSYAELVRSDAVVRTALDRGGLDLPVDAAQAALTATASSDTVLLSVRAELPDPGDAATLANMVAESATDYVATLETPVGGTLPLAKLTVVTPAVSDDTVVSPNVALNAAVGIVLGVFTGLLYILLRARLDTRIRSLGDLNGESILSVVPYNKQLAEGAPLDFSSGVDVATESFRKLRTNLAFARVDNPARVILVTSPNANEGKTVTSINLAAALAELSNRVVMVGADLRKPTMGSRMSLLGSIGLTNFLAAQATLDDVIQASGVEGLDVLACGSIPPNPSELLASARLSQAIDELRSRYDYVIVDSAPVLPVADSSVVATLTDGVVLVARCGRTRRQAIQDTGAELAKAGAAVLGVVLNDVKQSSLPYGYGYYAESIDRSATHPRYKGSKRG